MNSTGFGSPPSRSVLLVTSDEDIRAIYRHCLQLAGCLVEEAEDGREALAKALTRPHDVIVTEARLPGMDGYQLCQLLRRDLATVKTPVLLVAGDGSPSSDDRGRAAGADAVLVKPCQPETLLAEMRRLLETGRSRTLVVDGSPDDRGRTLAPRETGSARPILSRAHQRGHTTVPPNSPPSLVCPICDRPLAYQRSRVGGVSARHPEQWDYFECPGQCGTFEYRQRTRKLRQRQDEVNGAGAQA